MELEHATIRVNAEIFEEIGCNQIPASPVEEEESSLACETSYEDDNNNWYDSLPK